MRTLSITITEEGFKVTLGLEIPNTEKGVIKVIQPPGSLLSNTGELVIKAQEILTLQGSSSLPIIFEPKVSKDKIPGKTPEEPEQPKLDILF